MNEWDISKGPHDHPDGTRIQMEVDSIEETIYAAKEHGTMVFRDKSWDYLLFYKRKRRVNFV
ncbi:MAG: hypothetical protein ACQEWI_01150 [Bacillota bacterium]